MRWSHRFTATLFIGSLACLAAPPVQAAAKGERPKDSPGWIVLEEDWFFPFRFESAEALHKAQVHYRQNEEKAAANELRKAESWVKFAAGHALPETKKSLQSAADELHKLAVDVEQGTQQSAHQFDQTLAKTSRALAEWHYFKAKEHLGQDEETWAAEDLQAAARHLQAAARSAQYEYGSDDVVTVFNDINNYGKMIGEGVDIDRNSLAANLSTIGNEVKKLSEAMRKDSGS